MAYGGGGRLVGGASAAGAGDGAAGDDLPIFDGLKLPPNPIGPLLVGGTPVG